MDRLEYAHVNRNRYLDWCNEIRQSPYSDVDKMEWAILTASCKFEVSVAAFEASRGIIDEWALAEALYSQGMMAPNRRAAYIVELLAKRHKVTVTAAYVATIKSNTKKRSAVTISPGLEGLVLAKEFIQKAGGIEKADQLLRDYQALVE